MRYRFMYVRDNIILKERQANNGRKIRMQVTLGWCEEGGGKGDMTGITDGCRLPAGLGVHVYFSV